MVNVELCRNVIGLGERDQVYRLPAHCRSSKYFSRAFTTINVILVRSRAAPTLSLSWSSVGMKQFSRVVSATVACFTNAA